MPGPIPRREETLARPRARAGKERGAVTVGEKLPVTWPEPDPSWNAFAVEIYEAYQTSGQASWYQQSDIAILRLICNEISTYLSTGRRNAMILNAILGSLNDLLGTEGSRLRVRRELRDPELQAVPASVTAISSAKARLGKAKAS